MDIQSIYGSPKTAPAAAPSEEDKEPASGFAALLDMVGTQFKATLGIGMDPVVIKQDVKPDAPEPEPREAKARPERADEKDAKAKPAKDDGADDDSQSQETANDDGQTTQAADAGTNAQTGQQQQAAQAAVAVAIDAALVAQTTTTAPVVAAATVVETAVDTVVADVEVAEAKVVVADGAVKAAEAAVDVKAGAQTEVKAAEKLAAPEAVVKETTRTQQATNAYAPVQAAGDVETVSAETETVAAETKTGAKDNAVRTLDVRSAAAQEQANSLARLLGSENRIQVQVTTTAVHAAKQAVADVSIYNIYAGYTAVDAISLANGQFGQTEESNALVQSQAPRAEGSAQAAVAAQAQALPAPGSGAPSNAAAARADGVPTTAVQAGAPSGGASNAGMNFSAFTQAGQSGGTQQTPQAAQPNPTERPAATAQHVIDQIKVNITKAAKAGLDRVTIQLKPADLGRIEIKLEMSEDHKVRVTVTADTKDTLALLQTDSRTLERTLNDAGLRTDANNLHFNLRSEADPRFADGQNGRGAGRGGADGKAESAEDAPEPAYDYAAAAYARGGIDTFA